MCCFRCEGRGTLNRSVPEETCPVCVGAGLLPTAAVNQYRGENVTDKPKAKLATLRLLFWSLAALTCGLLAAGSGWVVLPVAALTAAVWRVSVEQLRVVAADDPWKYFFATSDLLRAWPVFYVLVGLPLSVLSYWAPVFVACQYGWALWWFTTELELYFECRVLETIRWSAGGSKREDSSS